jgi:hypothetical protein
MRLEHDIMYFVKHIKALSTFHMEDYQFPVPNHKELAKGTFKKRIAAVVLIVEELNERL